MQYHNKKSAYHTINNNLNIDIIFAEDNRLYMKKSYICSYPILFESVKKILDHIFGNNGIVSQKLDTKNIKNR